MELYIIKQHNKLMLISQSPLGGTCYFICLFCNVTIILEIQLQTQRGAEQVQWLPLLKTQNAQTLTNIYVPARNHKDRMHVIIACSVYLDLFSI